jgi:hypothetical protein
MIHRRFYVCNRSCTLDWISTLLTWSAVAVADEGYTCNRSSPLYWISILLTWSVTGITFIRYGYYAPSQKSGYPI